MGIFEIAYFLHLFFSFLHRKKKELSLPFSTYQTGSLRLDENGKGQVMSDGGIERTVKQIASSRSTDRNTYNLTTPSTEHSTTKTSQCQVLFGDAASSEKIHTYKPGNESVVFRP